MTKRKAIIQIFDGILKAIQRSRIENPDLPELERLENSIGETLYKYMEHEMSFPQVINSFFQISLELLYGLPEDK